MSTYLQRGVTGIYGCKDKSPVDSKTDLKAFRSDCHSVARALGAKIVAIKDRYDQVGVCNFAIAYIVFHDDTIAVLLNAVFPVLAFAKPPKEGQVSFDYVDCPKVAREFKSVGDYSIATAAEMNEPLVRHHYKDLAPFEVKRIRYFRPARVGDVVFNSWD